MPHAHQPVEHFDVGGVGVDDGFDHQFEVVVGQVSKHLAGRFHVQLLRLVEVLVLVFLVHQVSEDCVRGSDAVPLHLEDHR